MSSREVADSAGRDRAASAVEPCVGHDGPVIVHLVDGTYELFRQFFGRPGHETADGREVGACRAVLRNMLALRALGLATFAMTKYEADDAMAAAAVLAAEDERVEKVMICTPDKDLAQVVRAGRIVQFDRRKEKIYDVEDVIEKYGVPPESIPDWLRPSQRWRSTHRPSITSTK